MEQNKVINILENFLEFKLSGKGLSYEVSKKTETIKEDSIYFLKVLVYGTDVTFIVHLYEDNKYGIAVDYTNPFYVNIPNFHEKTKEFLNIMLDDSKIGMNMINKEDLLNEAKN